MEADSVGYILFTLSLLRGLDLGVTIKKKKKKKKKVGVKVKKK